jgi:hypothetical protein
MVFGDTPGAISADPQVGSSLAWSPCGRRVAVGCEKTLGDSMVGMVFFNGFLSCFVIFYPPIYILSMIYLCYPISMVIYLLKRYGDLVGTTVLLHFFIRFSYSRAHHFSSFPKPVAL